MEQKIKIIISLLIAILALSLLFNVQTISSKNSISRQRDQLKEENSELSQKIEAGLKSNKDLQGKIDVLNQSLEALTREKEILQKKFTLVDKARSDLVEQLKSIKEKPEEENKGGGGTPAQENYWAGVFQQKKNLEWEAERLRSETKTLQINNEQLQKEKSSLELEVTNLTREKDGLTRQLEYTQKQMKYNKEMMDTLSLELVGEKNDKLQIEETLKMIKGENYALRRQLKNLSDKKISLERKYADIESKNRTLENRFGEMDILLKDKMLQLDKMNKKLAGDKSGMDETVELSPIVVKPQTDIKDAASQGKVVALNRDNNFVVTDMGEESGSVRVGDILHVYNSDGKMSATLEVIETRKSISACDIRKETTPIKIGDIVKY